MKFTPLRFQSALAAGGFSYLSIAVATIIYGFVYLKFIGVIKPTPVAA